MNRRVLLVESSEAIRGVAEPVLRQNGYEVISVATAEKALQVLQFSRPDVIIAGAGLNLKGGQPFYQSIASDEKLSGCPMLLIVDSGSPEPSFPVENMVTLPLEPASLLQKTQQLVSRRQPDAVNDPQANPLDGVSVDGELIDAALGLDRIEVTDSEVMNQTAIPRRRREPDAGLAGALADRDLGETGRVESIIINDDNTDIVVKGPKTGPVHEQSNSSKLDILSDAEQYALDSPDVLQTSGENRDHDYEWFINEMKSDTHAMPASAPIGSEALPPESGVDGVLDIEDQADQTQGVSQILDEFRREVDKLDLGGPESIVIGPESPADSPRVQTDPQWVDSIHVKTGDDLEVFTKEFARELAEQIAARIVKNIDIDKLLYQIRSEIVARTRNHGGA